MQQLDQICQSAIGQNRSDHRYTWRTPWLTETLLIRSPILNDALLETQWYCRTAHRNAEIGSGTFKSLGKGQYDYLVFPVDKHPHFVRPTALEYTLSCLLVGIASVSVSMQEVAGTF